ncbi:MAG: VTT domain-containing protein [Deltaproteobacteria bacterium]|nr:VTT domain-containing protein [Deltaproteobacteria bacterium]
MPQHDPTQWIQTISEKCIECPLCRKECAYLQKYGTPKFIADGYAAMDTSTRHEIAFECGLCGLCAAVCPVGIYPEKMFMEMRQKAHKNGVGEFPEHAGILNYEKRGISRRYTWYAIPKNCDTIFFPGCTLPGTRPEKVKRLFVQLKETIPNLGFVLDCCTKPSCDLGREHFFQAMFDELITFLRNSGIRNVLVACPNCYKIFHQHGQTLTVKTVYEVLSESPLPEAAPISGAVVIHDPCAIRFEPAVQQAARKLIRSKGLTIIEMPHSGEQTVCCGEGGSVGMLCPEFTDHWRTIRKEEAGGQRIITYCAGCANSLNTVTPASHILDLIFEPDATLSGKTKVSRAPITYWNRIRLKNWAKQSIGSAITRERTFTAEKPVGRHQILMKLALFMLVIGAIITTRATGIMQYLEPAYLRGLIEGYGMLAPLIYMLFYSAAPALFLPGLPITLVGGILFGPVWGVIYTITSATIGACLAFLISRYMARAWIEQKLKSPRWKKLDEDVMQNGWKV